MKVEFDKDEIKRIKYISNLEKSSLKRILDWFTNVGITLEECKLEFEELFRSDTKSQQDMILVVSMNDVNKTHELHLSDHPPKGRYAMLIIIIPTQSHLMLTFNSTNSVLWFGTRIHKRDWGKVKGYNINETCKGHMSKNLYQKMDPIKDVHGQLVGLSIKRKSNVTFMYTIKDSAKAYLPAAFNTPKQS